MDQIVLDVLRQAACHEGEARLVKAGKKNVGLLQKRTGPSKKVIDVCLDADRPLLMVVRQEETGKTKKTVHQFVTISDAGLEVLVRNTPPEEYAKLVDEVRPDLRNKMVEQCLQATKSQYGELERQRQELANAQQRAAGSLLEFTAKYIAGLEAERTRIDDALRELNEQQRSIASKQAVPEQPKPPAKPIAVGESEEELDFQRDVSEELVYVWQDADTQETRDSLERVLLNLGLEKVGEPGEKAAFDGRSHVTDDVIDVGATIEVVQPGWRLVNARGSYLIARARVKTAQTSPEETQHVGND